MEKAISNLHLIAMDEERLRNERNIWLATSRPNGRPHLVPIWFVWYEQQCYVCTQESVKLRNLRQNPQVSFALEDGDRPVLAEGEARIISPNEAPSQVIAEFQRKYNWTLLTDAGYNFIIVIRANKWLKW